MSAPEIMALYGQALPWLAGFDLVCYVIGGLWLAWRAKRYNQGRK